MCEVIENKLHSIRAMRHMERCFFRISLTLHVTLQEPQRGEDPTPDKYISLMDLSPPGQISKSKIKL